MTIFAWLAIGAIAVIWILGMLLGKRFLALPWKLRTGIALGLFAVPATFIVLGHVLG